MSKMEIDVKSNASVFKQEAELSLQKAIETCGLLAEKYAKALCPVGTPESTGKKGYIGGTLRNSITHEVYKDEAYIGTNVEYAPCVELGTVKQRAQPYLRPAIEGHISEFRNIILMLLKT